MTMLHVEKHPLAGQMVKVQFKNGHPQLPGSDRAPIDFRIEDWWDHLTGNSWMTSLGNPAAIVYAIRSGINSLPDDDEVIYGHNVVDGLGHLVHATEIVA